MRATHRRLSAHHRSTAAAAASFAVIFCHILWQKQLYRCPAKSTFFLAIIVLLILTANTSTTVQATFKVA